MRAGKLAFAAVAAVTLAGCGSSSGAGSGAAASPVATDTTAAGTAATEAGTGGGGGGYGAPASAAATAAGSVRIASFHYDPTPVTVAPGQVVSVTNTDSAEHTATSDTAGLFLADDITTGKTVSFTAPSAPGTYTFHCRYHASMHGTLIVK
ncbi:MAG: hypothetical protein NVSMB55_23310 [Mycobacteriales bacterium]